MDIVYIKDLPNSFCINTFISNYIQNWNIDLEFVYISNFKNTKLLRDFVDSIFSLIWLPDDVIIKFILIVDELNNNAIEY